MTRSLSRLVFAAVILALSAAPLLAFPAAGLGSPTLSAPTARHSLAVDLVATVAGLGAVGMAIRIKDTGSIAKKFVARASVAQPEYVQGVQGAGGDWETNTRASEENYKAGVTQAAAQGRFGRGVQAAGAAKYVDRATKLGAQRYPTGVAASEGDYAKGVQPHLDMMKSLDLPPRGPKGDARNQQRAAVVAAANRALKVGK